MKTNRLTVINYHFFLPIALILNLFISCNAPISNENNSPSPSNEDENVYVEPPDEPEYTAKSTQIQVPDVKPQYVEISDIKIKTDSQFRDYAIIKIKNVSDQTITHIELGINLNKGGNITKNYGYTYDSRYRIMDKKSISINLKPGSEKSVTYKITDRNVDGGSYFLTDIIRVRFSDGSYSTLVY